MVIWAENEHLLNRMGWAQPRPVHPPCEWPRTMNALADAAGLSARPGSWSAEPGIKGWSQILVVDRSAASQYDLLRTLSPEQVAATGSLVCLARSGESFHGQHGRPWITLEGNLHLSLLVPLELRASTCASSLVMLPAVAVCDALTSCLGSHWLADGEDTGIKWVNDVLWHRQKIAGVLTASRSQQGTITSAVFGIGLNVSRIPDGKPEGSVHASFLPPACLGQIRPEGPPTLAEVLAHLLPALERRLEQLRRQGPGPLLEEYRRFSLVLGRRVIVHPETKDDSAACREGTVAGIAPDLSLALREDPRPIGRGRLQILWP